MGGDPSSKMSQASAQDAFLGDSSVQPTLVNDYGWPFGEPSING